MANYSNLKRQLDSAIYSNRSRAITGDILNAQLHNIIDALGNGYQYKGLASINTDPGAPDSNVFYLASAPGTYVHFANIVVNDGELSLLKYNGTWTKDSVTVGSNIDTVDVTVDNRHGTPSATGSVSGKTLSLSFHKLKGDPGEPGPPGPQGNPGSNQDYPFELENDPTAGGVNKASTAEAVKTVNTRVAQLEILLEAAPFDNVVDVVEDGFYLIDVDGNVCAKYTEEGWSAVEIADDYIALLQRYVSVTIGTVPGTAYDGGMGSELASRVSAIEAVTTTGSFGQHHYLGFDVVRPTNRPNHDCTWIGDEFWSFNKPSDGGALRIYNSNFETVASKTTNFVETRKDSTTKELEMKSIDWNAEKQALLIGNGAASYSVNDSYAYIFYEALNWKTASTTINFNNCGEYKQIDFTELGYKCYAFWGPSPELVFVSINLFQNVFLVRLGMGTNDLGHGVYSAADSGKYNGSWVVIRQWTQTPVSTGGKAAHGGQYYKGNLYLATNDSSVCRVYKCKLNNSGTLQFDVLHLEKYANSGDYVYRYIDGLCIKEDKIYAQPLNNTGGYNNALLIADIV